MDSGTSTLVDQSFWDLFTEDIEVKNSIAGNPKEVVKYLRNPNFKENLMRIGDHL